MKMGNEKKMGEERRKNSIVRVPAKVPLTEINEYLMCQLCFGYLIDATAIIECQHTFCKSCILKYLETNSYCPICEVQLNEAKPLLSLRSDDILQKLVYKLVPGLVSTEIRRRKDFGVKVSSETTVLEDSCVHGVKEAEEFCFLSRDDVVSLSLEYFKCDGDEDQEKNKISEESQTKSKEVSSNKLVTSTDKDKANDRRYLQCPAAVSVGLLKKFIRMKYGLSDDYRVDLLYNGDRENNLENDLTLLDLSFIFKWKKAEPMCFHYRIFDRPLKNLLGRTGVKRSAPAVLDEPPPDDTPPSTGPHQNHSTSSNSSTSSLSPKHPKFGGNTSASGGGGGSSGPSTGSTKGQQTSVTPIQSPLTSTQLPKVNLTLRGRSSTSTSRGDETEMSSGSSPKSSQSPNYGHDSSNCKNDKLSGNTNGSSDQKITTATTTASSSSSESPSSPLKISIKSPDGKHHHRHRHRHHKEKHKRRKSKSKNKDKDREREKSKEKERYKYNAHPNPSQSQTISVKPGKHHHHHHHHHHKSRDKDTSCGTVEKGSIANVTPTVPSVSIVTNSGKTQTRSGSAPELIGLNRRASSSTSKPIEVDRRASVQGIEFRPIPISSSSSSSSSKNTTHTHGKISGKCIQNNNIQGMKLPDSLQVQVPKSVTLIPVIPGSIGKISSTQRPNDKTNSVTGRPNNSQTFTHPITNKSLHQITVTEVPPPNTKTTSNLTTPNNISNNSNNIITIEKCSPGPNPSHSHSHSHSHGVGTKQLFNGPGSMEITKIYCDKPNSNGSSGSSSVNGQNSVSGTSSSSSSTTGNSGNSGKTKSVSVFESHTQQGKKLKGLDISITPTPSLKTQQQQQRKVDEVTTTTTTSLSLSSSSSSSSFPSKLTSLAGLPKIPGVSILPQSLHNAAKEQQQQQQQKKFGSGLMSFSCTKINEGAKVVGSSGNRLLPGLPPQQQRSGSPADTVNENKSSRNLPRKHSGDIYEISRGPSPSDHRKMSLPVTPSWTGLGHESLKSKNSQSSRTDQGGKGIKRSFESTSSSSSSVSNHSVLNKKPRGDPPPLQSNQQTQQQQQQQPEKKREESTLPLDLSGRSTRLSPPAGGDMSGHNQRPLTPIPLHIQPASPQSQSSPKTHRSQSVPTINSIVENLAQKHHHQLGKRSSTSSSSSKETNSPPIIIHQVPSPPSLTVPNLSSFGSHGSQMNDLLTLSNAAASARKMNQQKQQQQQQQHASSPLSNLVSAAAAIAGYNCTQQGQLGPPLTSPPPISPSNATNAMLPGLLQHFSHHQLNAMSQLMSPPGSGGLKSSILPHGGGNIFGNYPGLNGRMPTFGSVSQTGTSHSPPYYPTRSGSLGSISTNSTLKIPNLSNSNKHNSKNLLSSSSGVNLNTNNNGCQKNVKSKINGSNHSSPPHSMSSSSSSSSSSGFSSRKSISGGPPFSFGISNFLLKDTNPKGGIDPNAKAIITSLSSGLLEQRGDGSKSCGSSHHKSTQGHLDSIKGKNDLFRSKNTGGSLIGSSSSIPQAQILSLSKLLGTSSSSSSTKSLSPIREESGTGALKGETPSRLGDLGLALGLIPCDPPIHLTTTIPNNNNNNMSSKNNISCYGITGTTSSSLGSPSSSSSLGLSPSLSNTQQQNQAVRQIPNPSLLLSRQNSTHHNSGVNNINTSGEICQTRNLSGGNNNNNNIKTSVTTNKMDSSVSSINTTMKHQPQSIELNMKLWIDRYESLKSSSQPSLVSQNRRYTHHNISNTDEEGRRRRTHHHHDVKDEELSSSRVTFSASVPVSTESSSSEEISQDQSNEMKFTLPIIIENVQSLSTGIIEECINFSNPKLEEHHNNLDTTTTTKSSNLSMTMGFTSKVLDSSTKMRKTTESLGIKMEETRTECKMSSDVEKSHAVVDKGRDEEEEEEKYEISMTRDGKVSLSGDIHSKINLKGDKEKKRIKILLNPVKEIVRRTEMKLEVGSKSTTTTTTTDHDSIMIENTNMNSNPISIPIPTSSKEIIMNGNCGNSRTTTTSGTLTAPFATNYYQDSSSSKNMKRISLEKLRSCDYIPLVGMSESMERDNDSPVLVIDEDEDEDETCISTNTTTEEDVDIVRKEEEQEGENDNRDESGEETEVSIPIIISNGLTREENEEILSSSYNENERIEGNRNTETQTQTQTQTQYMNMSCNNNKRDDDPPTHCGEDPFPRVSNSPTLLIGSRDKDPLSSESESNLTKEMKNLTKVTTTSGGIFVSAGINNNNNNNNHNINITETRSVENELVTLPVVVPHPPTNQTPPPPTVTNV